MNTGEKIAQVMRRLMAGEIVSTVDSGNYKLIDKGICILYVDEWLTSSIKVQELALLAAEEPPKPEQVSASHVRKVEL